ncbi:MAG: PEGA domain-containing protein [Ignavibacteriales bacterium]|nr:PEGA domain-containing protein [Ignavibacteriales bacterium]
MIYKPIITIAGIRKLFFLIPILAIFTSSCDKQLSTSPVEPEPQKGKLIFDSNPQGFTIFINGKNTGSITPDSLTFLDAGTYDVTLKKKYYKDSLFTLQLLEDEGKNLFIDYMNNPSMFGKLNLFTIPAGASIKIFDSLLISTTPDTIEHLLPGEYTITLSYPEHRSVTFNSIVESGKINLYSNVLQDTSEWVDFQVFNSGIVSNNLKSLAIDHNNYKWIGSIDKGLQKFDGFNFITYNITNSNIPSNRINVIKVDNNNNIWIGTNNGIGIFNGVSWTNYDKNNSGLSSNDILSIDFDDIGNTWIGVSTGLYKFDGINWTRYNDADYNLWTNDLKVASDNSIWLATNSGIIKFNSGVLTYYPDSVYLYPTNIVSAIDIDQTGSVWSCHQNVLGSRNGVSIFNGTSFTNSYYGSSTNILNDVFIDKNNRKWISTNEGLVLVKQDGSTISYKKSNSLISSDAITSCCLDLNGDLWITSFGGGFNKFKVH